jgi:phosphohistidine phosphatase
VQSLPRLGDPSQLVKAPRSRVPREVIWLLRHGDAADGSPDAERPLTEKGERQARNAGRALKRLGVKFDACLTSPKVRARETARIACEELGVEWSEEAALQGGPFDPNEVAAGLEEVLLVGHDPDFSMAVHTLTGAQVRMKKGGLAATSKGELIVMLRPHELEAIAE